MARMVIEQHPEEENASGWWAYFDGKPTKADCLAAWNKKYGDTDAEGDSDIDMMPDSGPRKNKVNPKTHKKGIWRVWLGCCQ